jgi:SpoVK/Ycf46/Vps4 family AAA+-type ATPase
LNAVQRRYPQIYKSNDRLLLKPESIEVELRDFMISVKSGVPFLELPFVLTHSR